MMYYVIVGVVFVRDELQKNLVHDYLVKEPHINMKPQILTAGFTAYMSRSRRGALSATQCKSEIFIIALRPPVCWKPLCMYVCIYKRAKDEDG